MENYIGKICPFCKTEIQPDDEVQVCPKCGIAHHKSCWDENLGCTTFGCAGNHGQNKANHLTCENCGAVMEITQKFCPKCGRPQTRRTQPSTEQAQKNCPSCGTPNSITNKFCIRCSAPLTSPPAMSATAPVASASTATVPSFAAPAAVDASGSAAAVGTSRPNAARPDADSLYAARNAPASAVKHRNKGLLKLIACMIGIVSGLLSAVLGLITYGMDTGSYASSLSYGGDAYTGIQNAAAQSANNMLYASEIIRFGFGSLLLVLGLFIIALFIFLLCKDNKAKTKK